MEKLTLHIAMFLREVSIQPATGDGEYEQHVYLWGTGEVLGHH